MWSRARLHFTPLVSAFLVCGVVGVKVSSPRPARLAVADTLVLANAFVVRPDTDKPARLADLVIADGLIVRILDAPNGAVHRPKSARVLDVGRRYVLPGLVDAHVHIGGFAAAKRALASGVTTVRSAGVAHFVDVGLRELVANKTIDGPEFLAAGYHVQPEPWPTLFLDEPALADLLQTGIRDSAGIRRVVQAMVSRRVDLIKVNATARAGLPDTDPREATFSEDLLKVLVNAASAAGLPVAAHAHGDTGARAAVRAGVRSIEHGTYLSDETLRLMRERGTFLVPTIAIIRDLAEPGGDYDDAFLLIRGRQMLPRLRETTRRAYDEGVQIVAATDTGYGNNSQVRMGSELVEFVQVGLTPREALRAATATPAELLGLSERTGRIAVGFEADLIVLDRNPLDEIEAVNDVLAVFQDGVLVVDRIGLRHMTRR